MKVKLKNYSFKADVTEEYRIADGGPPLIRMDINIDDTDSSSVENFIKELTEENLSEVKIENEEGKVLKEFSAEVPHRASRRLGEERLLVSLEQKN